MKAIYTAAFLLLSSLYLTSCLDNVVEGHGAMSTESRPVNKAFNSVEIDAPVDATITIQPGSTSSFSLSGYSNLLKHIRTEIKDSTLHIFIPEITEMHTDKNLTAQITLPSLIGLSISGSSDVNIVGDIIGSEFNADASGAAKINVQSVNVDNMTVDMSGKGSFSALGGKVGVAEYDASGAMTIKAYGLECRRVRVDMSGAGHAEVFATEKLKADVSGAGNVTYKGNPQLITDISGIGSVSRADGSPNPAEANASSDRNSTDNDW